MRVFKRPLSQNEAQQIFVALREEPAIPGYTLNELVKTNQAFIAMIDDRLAGFIIVNRLLAAWSEIAAIYVFPEFRNLGVSSCLLKTVVDELENQKMKMLVMTAEPKLLQILKKLGFEINSTPRALPKVLLYDYLKFNLNPYRFAENFRKAFKYRRKASASFCTKRPH